MWAEESEEACKPVVEIAVAKLPLLGNSVFCLLNERSRGSFWPCWEQIEYKRFGVGKVLKVAKRICKEGPDYTRKTTNKSEYRIKRVYWPFIFMNYTWLVEIHLKLNFILLWISRFFLRLNLIVFKLCGIIYVSEGWCIEIFIVIQWNFRLGNLRSQFNYTILFHRCGISFNGYGLLVTLFLVKICIIVSCDNIGPYFSV